MNVKDKELSKETAPRLIIRKVLISYSIAVSVACVIGWPLVSNPEKTQCGIVVIALWAFLFISMIHLGSLNGIGRWLLLIFVGIFSLAAPLVNEICVSPESSYGWVIGVMFLVLNVIIDIKSRSNSCS